MSSYTGYAQIEDDLPAGGASGDVLTVSAGGQPDWFTPDFQEIHNDLSISALTGVDFNVRHLDLDAGVWDVEANVIFELDGATVTQLEASISQVSNTPETDNSVGYIGTQYTTATVKDSLRIKKRITLAAAGTVYLVANTVYSAGIVGVLASMTANKVS